MKITATQNGPVKELHGVNCAPYSAISQEKLGRQPAIERLFGYAGIPRSRLHDCCGTYGGSHFVDIPNIFPNFDADENDPASYDFHYTDEYIGAIIATGAQIVYRLGITIEWGTKKYTCFPPKDPAKWARICEHVVRHYNEGWADGFHYNIEYWEIWNEPENPPMWQGTREEYFELYRVTSHHLRACFPSIKIGGYGSCGFYAVWQPERRDFYHSFLRWFDAFLAMVKAENCPLDFFSWHIYTPNVEDVVCSAKYARAKLDEYGFEKTESHLNEWNFGAEGPNLVDRATDVGASFCAAALAEMQVESVDLAQYYVAHTSTYNGLTQFMGGAFTPVAHVFWAFNQLFRAGTALTVEREENEPYLVAATDGARTLALVSHYAKEAATATLSLPRAGRVQLFRLSDEGFVLCNECDTDVLTLDCKKNDVYFVTQA